MSLSTDADVLTILIVVFLVVLAVVVFLTVGGVIILCCCLSKRKGDVEGSGSNGPSGASSARELIGRPSKTERVHLSSGGGGGNKEYRF